MTDWSHSLATLDRLLAKVRADLQASQSCGPSARAMACVNAQQHALQVAHEAHLIAEWARDQQRHPGSF